MLLTIIPRHSLSRGPCFIQLGGKDPAYVRPDADLDYTAAELVDGSLNHFIFTTLNKSDGICRCFLQFRAKLLLR